MKVVNHFDLLEKVVKGDDGIEKHEQGLGNFEDVLHGAGGLWFEIANTIVSHIANCTSYKWRKIESRYDSFSISTKLSFERREGIGLGAMPRTGLQDMPRILRNQYLQSIYRVSMADLRQ